MPILNNDYANFDRKYIWIYEWDYLWRHHELYTKAASYCNYKPDFSNHIIDTATSALIWPILRRDRFGLENILII